MKINHMVARDAALELRGLGLVALPSRDDDKHPAVEYTRYRTESVTDDIYDKGFWHYNNLQIMTGAKTSGKMKVVVVDLDGPEAVAAWKKMCRVKGYKFEGTWISVTGGGGKHIYFELPAGVTEVTSRQIWGLWDTFGGPLGNGCFVKHKEIRILGDNSLAVAPPSKHIETGKEYRWMGAYGPAVYSRPAAAPEWLLKMPAVKYPVAMDAKPYIVSGTPRVANLNAVDRDRVVELIGPRDKLALARQWGLRLTGRQVGHWAECHAIDREDNKPSAGFDPRTGVYHDNGTGKKLSFFDVALELGAFTSFEHAISSLRKFSIVAGVAQ